MTGGQDRGGQGYRDARALPAISSRHLLLVHPPRSGTNGCDLWGSGAYDLRDRRTCYLRGHRICYPSMLLLVAIRDCSCSFQPSGMMIRTVPSLLPVPGL